MNNHAGPLPPEIPRQAIPVAARVGLIAAWFREYPSFRAPPRTSGVFLVASHVRVRQYLDLIVVQAWASRTSRAELANPKAPGWWYWSICGLGGHESDGHSGGDWVAGNAEAMQCDLLRIMVSSYAWDDAPVRRRP